MSENLPVDGNVNQEVPEQNTEIKTPEYSKIELEAMEMGWRPREEFNGDDDDFIDAKEFVRRKPLFDKIEKTGSELKQMRKAFDALKTHYTSVHESAYKQALANLKKARQQAITDSDGERFEEIDNEIKRVEAAVTEIKTVGNVEESTQPQVDPRFTAWTNRNPWYTSVSHMRAFADEFGSKLAAQGVEPIEILKQVEKAVREEFPNRFRNSNKDDAPDVGTSGTRPNSAKKDDFKLSEQEERIFQTLHKSDPKTFTREKYVAELKAVKGIK